MEHNIEPILQPKHKIFLSHSGQQKEFVEHLCEALERRCHTPFFDKRLSSLPKGETFPNFIFKAVEQCKMMVVVIFDDYFMSKWPMMELHAFVQAIEAIKDKPSNTREKYILPLFYKLSVEEFRDKERREKWTKTWMVTMEGAKRREIDVHAWEKAVDVLGTYNGIVYKFSGIRDYLDEIVLHICGKIIPDVKWDDSHVQGKSDLCKVLCENIDGVGISDEHGCKILGIFGVGGIGKTTICKALCNELSNEYEGRVCHIELKTQVRTTQVRTPQETTSSVVESLRKLVILLANKNAEFVQNLDEGEAKTFLKTPNFHEESLVIVTARSRDTLEMLEICGDVCVEMPKLGAAEAEELFLYHAAGGKQFEGEEEKRDILMCIERCHFNKIGEFGSHYHPLALQSLGVQLGCVGKKPSEWVEKLPRVKNFNYFGGENPVFDILRSSFDMLRACEQSLFMDLAIYKPFALDSRIIIYKCDINYSYNDSCWKDMVEWLCLVHKVDEEELKSMFDGLKRKGLLQDVDWTSGSINVHDLYVEFAGLESTGKLDDEEDLDYRRYMNIISSRGLTELDKSPSSKCWQRLSRVNIYATGDYSGDPREVLKGIDGRFSNVVVLKLERLNFVSGSLNLKDLECLRSLSLFGVRNLEKIEGLGGLRRLTFFKWHGYDCKTIIRELPKSLEVVNIILPIQFDRIVLAQCKSLRKLELDGIRGVELDLSGCSSLQSMLCYDLHELQSLDLSSCLSLQSVKLEHATSLHSLMLVCDSRVARGLKSIELYKCLHLIEILGLDELFGLEVLKVDCSTPFLQLGDLRRCTNLQVLKFEFDVDEYGFLFDRYSDQGKEGGVKEVGCFIPWQLQEFSYWCGVTKTPILSGCTQLKVLELDFEVPNPKYEDNCGLATNLECLVDLPALRSLTLKGCKVLSEWPDLSRSMKLEMIELKRCEMELHENDILMLTLLPLLGPLIIDGNSKLNLVRRKVLRRKNYSSPWEESDLDIPSTWERGGLLGLL